MVGIAGQLLGIWGDETESADREMLASDGPSTEFLSPYGASG